ncbi:MAG: relaxase/mobilization nuclease RlxS [Pseudomonadota bacterium]
MEEGGFEPRLGKMRSGGSRRGRKYLHAVLAAAARGGLPSARGKRRFNGSRIGRGGVTARVLRSGDRYSGLRARRAIVKTRLVRLGGNALGAARAHLRYIQRDGVTRDDEPGRLYSAAEDRADGKAFLERCGGDRHQFRIIVSAEDGAEYEDLKPLIRRFMARIEDDLGTRLDWVAADHVDTLHPHTHIMLRGKDERGENLVIAPDYIKQGMRERLAGLVSLDLGPRTDLEIQRRLRIEVHAERLTSLDRRLLRGMDARRVVSAGGRDMFDHAIRIGRLRKLASLGLAEELGGGRWRLGEDLEATLRRLGEQGDIVRTMQRALNAAGLERAAAEQIVHRPEVSVFITGRIVERGPADETRDRHYLIVDGIDGRSHYVDIGKGERTEPLPEGAIVRIEPRGTAERDTDRRIAAIAAEHGGRYSIDIHLAAEPGSSARFAETHVRRLEAIRRGVGGVERFADGSWSIPPEFEALAGRYEALRAREAPVEVVLLSPLPLERLPHHHGATWLDRELASPEEAPRDQGFGRELRSALALRRAWLIGQGLGAIEDERFVCRPDMLAILQRRELLRVAAGISEETGLEFVPAKAGSRVEGVVRRRLDLASGRFAMIENGREFALVPWRPVLARAIDRRVSGMARQDGGISWTISRSRGLEV